jgi:hypothetical protein
VAGNESVISCADRFVRLMHVDVESFDGTGKDELAFRVFDHRAGRLQWPSQASHLAAAQEKLQANGLVADTLLPNVDFWSLLFL